ncbi:Spy/CpxP family protein refolding chaperone [Candidatus Methylospira mobilis]|uniref:Spy/CpxP family protein refolding chaperone n=1 Tax=Candidatus Methylospira mobilis TaxID=1808979 RepID=UPI0028ED1981|nr:Spy/CpxP family protein refolding chaperone [Candidatus Methylospira mobilis]WNV03941.1 Spy/CpxP family protein refolding chaperone [Candidatus Methylospira mobilis]
MKPGSNNLFTWANAHFIAAAMLVAALIFAPVLVLATDKDDHEDRAELRIKDMHARLKITQGQEEQWTKVAQVTRDNAKIMDALTQARHDHAGDMTAIDDLKSYGEITDAHADGIKKLTTVFAALYACMSDTQKKEADTLFRHGGDNGQSDLKRAHKTSERN